MRVRIPLLLILGAASCGEAPPNIGTATGTDPINQIVLTFFPADGGPAIVGAWSFADQNGNGEQTAASTPVTLTPETSYTMQVEFQDITDRSEILDVTALIADAADEHQVLIDGEIAVSDTSTVGRPVLRFTYADQESDYIDSPSPELPVGLSFMVETGTITVDEEPFRILLRELPIVDGTRTKGAGTSTNSGSGLVEAVFSRIIVE